MAATAIANLSHNSILEDKEEEGALEVDVGEFHLRDGRG